MAIGIPSSLGFTSTASTYDSTSLSLAASAIPNNSLVVVLTGCNNNQDASATNPISGVSEGAHNYSLAVAKVNGTTQFYQIWYYYYTTGVATPTITTAWATINRLKVLQAVSITGVDSLDKTNSSAGTGTSASTASGALIHASEIVIGGIFLDSGTAYSAGTGFTNALNNTNSASSRLTLDYDIVSTTSSVTHAPSWTGSSAYSAVLATFKAAVTNAQSVAVPCASSVSVVVHRIAKLIIAIGCSTAASFSRRVAKAVAVASTSLTSISKVAGKAVSAGCASAVSISRGIAEIIDVTCHVTLASSVTILTTFIARVRIIKIRAFITSYFAKSTIASGD